MYKTTSVDCPHHLLFISCCGCIKQMDTHSAVRAVNRPMVLQGQNISTMHPRSSITNIHKKDPVPFLEGKRLLWSIMCFHKITFKKIWPILASNYFLPFLPFLGGLGKNILGFFWGCKNPPSNRGWHDEARVWQGGKGVFGMARGSFRGGCRQIKSLIVPNLG